MKQLLVVGIIILFVGAGILPSSIGITENKVVPLENTSKGYIQNLIDNASNGDTIYIPSGIYYENIIINKSISLVGEDKDTTIIDGGGSGCVVAIDKPYANLNGFTIRNNSGGAWLSKGIDITSNYNTITGNNISNNRIGINFGASKFNIIMGNINSNNGCGIELRECKFNIIKGNSISNNKDGIILTRGSGIIAGILLFGIDINLISKNNFIDNEQDAYFTNSFFNKWILNYWNKPRILPKLITGKLKGLGSMSGPGPEYSKFNFDWRPALKPYDIQVGI